MPKWSEVNPITGFGRLVNMKSFCQAGDFHRQVDCDFDCGVDVSQVTYRGTHCHTLGLVRRAFKCYGAIDLRTVDSGDSGPVGDCRFGCILSEVEIHGRPQNDQAGGSKRNVRIVTVHPKYEPEHAGFKLRWPGIDPSGGAQGQCAVGESHAFCSGIAI